MGGPVLGLGGSNHDFSAAVVVDGRIECAIEDERLQRIKRGTTEWHATPARDAADYCLGALNLQIHDMDGVFCCDDLERPQDWLDWSKVTMLNHHACHAAAAFFSSPHEESALLVVDGHGSVLEETRSGLAVETISIGSAGPDALHLEALQTGIQRKTSSSWRYVTQNSIGWFYKIVTFALGFGGAGQGKAMGLAAYGRPRFVNELSDFVEIGPEGRFGFDPYGGIWGWLTAQLDAADNPAMVRADLAFAAQEIFVEAIVAAANEAHRRHPSPALCFGGGCALNTLANSRILGETPFAHVWVYPAAGDGGLAVGAAFYGAHVVHGHARPDWCLGTAGRNVYTGRHYSSGEVLAAISNRPVLPSRPSDLVGEVAAALNRSETVAVCRAGSEIGPRALGHRSLLAHPFTASMRDHINLNIKDRESFRPLAPSVPLESVGTYFDGVDESPYMLFVARVRADMRDKLAAVTHVDGTARVQTVRVEDNPFLHALLVAFGDLTGVPVLLNTSLNRAGEPIVETPEDALDLFVERPVDLLVLDDILIRKYTPWVGPEAMPRSLRLGVEGR